MKKPHSKTIEIKRLLEKLEAKAESGYRDKVRMPNIKKIYEVLGSLGVQCTFSESVNIVEYKSKGRRYVNSRHRGKEGYNLEVKMTEDEAKAVGQYLDSAHIGLDTSDSYYSLNSRNFAGRLVKLIRYKLKEPC